MIGESLASRARPAPELLGQTVVVIGGSAGIGLETARQARAHGAEVVITGRNQDRLREAARAVEARSTSAFDAHDGARLVRFFHELPAPIDHVMVTAGGPHYAPLADMDFTDAGPPPWAWPSWRTLPIRRVVGPADVAALAVHIMSNEALTGATFDIDGGQQLISDCPE